MTGIVTDGTAVLGLGDIGPEAAMPVMEGKAILFKEFADVDAFPICLDTKDVDEIIETVKRIANLDTAADDFRIIWDNAYIVHDLTETSDNLLNIFNVLPERNKNMVIEVTSTSKISFPGAGVSCLASSEENIKEILKRLTVQSISYDKMNMLRHVKYFKNIDGIGAHSLCYVGLYLCHQYASARAAAREFRAPYRPSQVRQSRKGALPPWCPPASRSRGKRSQPPRRHASCCGRTPGSGSGNRNRRKCTDVPTIMGCI